MLLLEGIGMHVKNINFQRKTKEKGKKGKNIFHFSAYPKGTANNHKTKFCITTLQLPNRLDNITRC